MNSYYMSCDYATFFLVLLIRISMRSEVILLYFKKIRSDSEPRVSERSGFGCLGSHKDLQGDFEACLQQSLQTLVLWGLASPLLEHRPCVIFQILPVASSLVSLGWCPARASLPHYFRLGWYAIWHDMGYDFLRATGGLAGGEVQKFRGVTFLWGEPWPMRNGKWEGAKISDRLFGSGGQLYGAIPPCKPCQRRPSCQVSALLSNLLSVFMASEVVFSWQPVALLCLTCSMPPLLLPLPSLPWVVIWHLPHKVLSPSFLSQTLLYRKLA